MSGFKIVQTQMQDQNLIIEALETAFPEFKGRIEVSNKPIRMQGHGEETANIVIRSRSMHGKAEDHGYADMGLRLVGDRFEWVISDCDQGNYEKNADGTPNQAGHYNSSYGNYGPEFQGEVMSAYSALEGLAEAERVGWRATGAMQQMNDPDIGNCWGTEVEISEEELNKLQIHLPA
jgi:hypothetical protein